MIVCICACEFRDEILLRGKECKTRVHSNFSKINRANTVNLQLRCMLKILNFSRSQMTKQTSPLTSSREI